MADTVAPTTTTTNTHFATLIANSVAAAIMQNGGGGRRVVSNGSGSCYGGSDGISLGSCVFGAVSDTGCTGCNDENGVTKMEDGNTGSTTVSTDPASCGTTCPSLSSSSSSEQQQTYSIKSILEMRSVPTPSMASTTTTVAGASVATGQTTTTTGSVTAADGDKITASLMYGADERMSNRLHNGDDDGTVPLVEGEPTIWLAVQQNRYY
ncbi:unnamed protein product [Enterobius vermicularis]|uniref:Expansin-like EG45 domain-containing protein n=1 Tax=Enterobius vermicularis TaxID=51028 RepID=A0A0N4VQ08_ENTVE|nr:unnamed protein product [Enterobius vermicularis]